jgi:hypothetical protein
MFKLYSKGLGRIDRGTFVCTNLNINIIMMLHRKKN